MSDISAVVLTLGENTTEDAIASVKSQTQPPSDINLVDSVTPFHKALNTGAARIYTRFFVQVDSDMILDKNCFAMLRDCINDQVGLVVGHLRDPMIGRIQGVKLFRTECFQRREFKNTVSPDTDYSKEAAEDGWQTLFALNYASNRRQKRHTFGRHVPNYTPHYTFSKYTIEGRRYRYRNNVRGLFWNMKCLRESQHPMAMIARLALGNGIFTQGDQDMLTRYGRSEDFERLKAFMDYGDKLFEPDAQNLPQPTFSPTEAFRDGLRQAVYAKENCAYGYVEQLLRHLSNLNVHNSWWFEIGVARGLFVPEEDSCRDGDMSILNFMI